MLLYEYVKESINNVKTESKNSGNFLRTILRVKWIVDNIQSLMYPPDWGQTRPTNIKTWLEFWYGLLNELGFISILRLPCYRSTCPHPGWYIWNRSSTYLRIWKRLTDQILSLISIILIYLSSIFWNQTGMSSTRMRKNPYHLMRRRHGKRCTPELLCRYRSCRI